jgi:hypothetical protein
MTNSNIRDKGLVLSMGVVIAFLVLLKHLHIHHAIELSLFREELA